MDLVAKAEHAQVIGRAAAALGLSSEELTPLSAKYGTGVESVLLAVVQTEPEITAALGAALPAYRWKLAQVVIGRAASTAAAIAVAPLPFLDFVPLLGLQAAMVLGIARVYNYKITLARARELVATFGLGLLARMVFHEMSKLGGPPAWLVAAAVAAGTTTAMGYAAAAWFERGERLSPEAMKRISKAVGDVVIERLKSLGRRRPGRRTLRQKIDEALAAAQQTDERLES